MRLTASCPTPSQEADSLMPAKIIMLRSPKKDAKIINNK